MPLSKTTAIESNSNPQFVIAAFKLLKEKTLSGTTAFAKHTSLSISLAEKLNSSFFFPHKHYFDLKLFLISPSYNPIQFVWLTVQPSYNPKGRLTQELFGRAGTRKEKINRKKNRVIVVFVKMQSHIV